ncbi:MAG TPA: DUF938 domain-containing protein [Rhodospirillales bacterium]|nr:DUF938 domain-containing protein [Rhodospirillales bacterium]
MAEISDFYNAPIASLGGGKRDAPAARRNREPLLDVLEKVLPKSGLVLEIASGTGQHCAYFAPRFPALEWQPSDADADMRLSIAAWGREGGGTNLLAPLDLDVQEEPWPVDEADAVLCINMIHITPWPICCALMAGAGRVLGEGGVLVLYGPFRLEGRHTAPSNADFDRSLQSRNPEWGVRERAEVVGEAAKHGLILEEAVEMPSNNLSLIFRKRETI